MVGVRGHASLPSWADAGKDHDWRIAHRQHQKHVVTVRPLVSGKDSAIMTKIPPARDRRVRQALIATAVTTLLFGAQSVSADVIPDGAAVTYSATRIIPPPPASSFVITGSGDGWDLKFYDGNVYNVFHHESALRVDCHDTTTAAACTGYPKTIVNTGNSGQLASPPRPTIELDATTGTMRVWATDRTTSTAGVVAIDLDSANANPFISFTPLSAVGDADTTFNSSNITQGVRIDDKWYAYNSIRFGTGITPTGTVGTIMCFDFTTEAACAGQPYALPGLTAMWGRYHAPMMAPIGSRIIVTNYEGTQIGQHYCFDTAINGACTGNWPHAAFGYELDTGTPVPALDGSGNQIGLCYRSPDFTYTGLPGAVTCVDGEATVLTAASVALAAAINESDAHPDAGERFTMGTRVYMANGNNFAPAAPYYSNIDCFDWATEARCPNFPVTFTYEEIDLLYNVTSDPANPTCLWLMGHAGAQRITNLDAYTAGPCGEGGTRIQLGSFVEPPASCVPTEFTSLTVVSPVPADYSGGTLTFTDANAAPIAELPVQNLDGAGVVDLSVLGISTSSGLPTMQIDLPGAETDAITLKIEWTGEYHDECDNGGQIASYASPPTTEPTTTEPTTTEPSTTELLVLPSTGVDSRTNNSVVIAMVGIVAGLTLLRLRRIRSN